MELCERIIRHYFDEDAKRIFLVSTAEFEELLQFEELLLVSAVEKLRVIHIDSQEGADLYTLQRKTRPACSYDGISFPEQTIEKVVVQPDNFYLLDTRSMPTPSYFNHMFLTDRFYDVRYSTTSAVVAIRDHVDMINPEHKPELFFTNWQKLKTVIADLSHPDPYRWK